MSRVNKMKAKTMKTAEEYTMPQEGFVRQPVVLKVLGISKSTLWRRIDEGVYPRPIKLSLRAVAWRVKDIRALIRSFDEPEETAYETE